MHDKTQIKDINRRLQIAQGHIGGIKQMVTDQAYCIDVLRQIRAVQKSLDKVALRILDGHLHSCVTTAVNGTNQEAREKVLKELLEIFEENKKR